MELKRKAHVSAHWISSSAVHGIARCELSAVGLPNLSPPIVERWVNKYRWIQVSEGEATSSFHLIPSTNHVLQGFALYKLLTSLIAVNGDQKMNITPKSPLLKLDMLGNFSGWAALNTQPAIQRVYSTVNKRYTNQQLYYTPQIPCSPQLITDNLVNEQFRIHKELK